MTRDVVTRDGVNRGLALRIAAARLAATGAPSPDLDARLLLLDVLALDHGRLIATSDVEMPAEELAAFGSLVARRIAGEPIARILGRREFWSLSFQLAPEALVPRPDTETVVEAALGAVAALRDRPLRILDLGVGSGCILLALLSELPQATGVGVDRSEAAAATARINARALGLLPRAAFMVGNWAAAIDGVFDLVVSNPPYIATCEIQALAPEVRDHDPIGALDGGPDGLDGHRALAVDLRRLLAPEGRVVIELGAGQGAAVARLLQDAGLSPVGQARPDGCGVPRALLAQRSASWPA